ncbi:hypothetical protein PYW07_006488 [Mythimna separata]|uniref:Zinc finger DNA binding protein n=1 Tax=Mythimna separata TaxID=271217 RepID=A0AAD8DWJ3_MYTSE|nr:hypothetical protein PYW07_006488 [Mythimna separata]
MVIKRCVRCKKNVTKKLPGLECSRCDKVVHADPVCSKLSNKQLNTLKNLPGIEWSCEECLKNLSRRSSFVIPEEDDDENDYEDPKIMEMAPVVDAKKLVQDISREVKKAFREEIRSLENSLEFLSEQLTSMEQAIKRQDSKIKDLENKNYDLQNKNKNLELRINVLEQGFQEVEQQSLATALEVAGLPEMPSNDIEKVMDTVASELNVADREILSTRRLPGSKDKPGPILVELKSKTLQQQWIGASKESCITVGQLKSKTLQQQWIGASKESCITVGQLVPNIPKEKADDRVYIREALTKYQKTLLYNAKTQLLNKSCQYVWCKNGKVYARKLSNSKIYYIRTLQDIKQIERICSTQPEKQRVGSTPL